MYFFGSKDLEHLEHIYVRLLDTINAQPACSKKGRSTLAMELMNVPPFHLLSPHFMKHKGTHSAPTGSVVNSRVVAVEPSNIAVSMLKAANAIGHVMAPVALIAGTIRPHLWCGYRLPGWTTGQPVGYRGGLQVNHPPVELLTSGHGNLYYE